MSATLGSGAVPATISIFGIGTVPPIGIALHPRDLLGLNSNVSAAKRGTATTAQSIGIRSHAKELSGILEIGSEPIGSTVNGT